MNTGTMRIHGDRVELRQGGGCLILFGFPFFIAGLGVMTSPLWATGEPASLWIAGPFGFLFAAVGASLMFWRGGVTIDRGSGTVRTWWGFLVPWSEQRHPLANLRAVGLSREVRQSKNSRYTVYPVRLEHNSSAINISAPTDYQQARADAEQLAKFLGLPLRDSSGGTVVERQAAHLDESLRQRATRTGRARNLPVPPDGCRIQHRIGGGEARFVLPRRGHHLGMILMLLPALLFSGFAYFVVLRHVFGLDAPQGLRVVIFLFGIAFLVVPILVTLVAIARQATLEERILVSPHTLRVEKRAWLKSNTIEIPTHELEDLHLAASEPGQNFRFGTETGIWARSDRARVMFGTALTQEEKNWLRDVIEFVVTVPAR